VATATVATAVLRTAVVLGQRADAQATGLAQSVESTTSHLGTSASSAKPVARMAVATASAEAVEGAPRHQPAQVTGSARNAKSTTSRHVTIASAAKSRNRPACRCEMIVLLRWQPSSAIRMCNV
jgi:hypothetical protein